MFIALNKQKLRERLKKERAFSKSEEKEAQMMQSLFSFILRQNRKLILTYVSTASEISTRLLISQLLSMDYQVAVPRIKKERQMDFYQIHSLNELQTNRYGILEPSGAKSSLRSTDDSICIVPGLAFDVYGGRLGYGGGYYDLFLHNYSGISIGLVYHSFLYKNLPFEAHDQRVDYMITEKTLIKAKNIKGINY